MGCWQSKLTYDLVKMEVKSYLDVPDIGAAFAMSLTSKRVSLEEALVLFERYILKTLR